MKPAILVPVALVAGLAGGTALYHPPPAPPVAEGDSTHQAAPSPAGQGGEKLTPVTPPGEVHDPSPAPVGATAPAGETAAPDAGPTPGFDAQRTAAILDKLPPTDVPALIVQFKDADMEAVLRRLDAARVAAVLAALPKERATVISRRLLVPGTP